MLSPIAVKKTRQADHGKYIYAYCNERTKQVLYSLSRSLQPSALKQLPDIGANLTPPKLRKDAWKPLYSVQLPDTPDGRQQGIDAFKMLRECRMLHETNWEPPMELNLKYNKKRREALKDALENRGGCKKEYVHDLIKREKKLLRQRIVMDQKANSIADLAAVLLQQGDRGEILQTERAKEAERSRRNEVQEMLRKAEESKSGRIQDLQKRQQDLLDNIKEGRAQGQLNKTRLQIKNISKEIEKTEFAAAAVKWVELPEARRRQEREYWEKQAAIEVEDSKSGNSTHLRFAKNRRLQGYDGQQIAVVANAAGLRPVLEEPPMQPESVLNRAPDDMATDREKLQMATQPMGINKKVAADDQNENVTGSNEISYAQLLPSFPPQFNPLKTPIEKLPKRDHLRQVIKRSKMPLYTTEGIIVRWANPLDAEFAATWPGEVKHEEMGIARHTHPKVVTDEAINDISVFKALNWKQRKQAWEMESEGVEARGYTWAKMQELRAEMGMVEDPLHPSRMVHEKTLSPFLRERLEAARIPRNVTPTTDIHAQEPVHDESTALPSDAKPMEPAEPESVSEEQSALSPEEQQVALQEAVSERQAFLKTLVWRSKHRSTTISQQQIDVALDRPAKPTEQWRNV